MSKEADQLRLKVLQMGWSAGSGHMGGSLSCAEILNVLYSRVMHFNRENVNSYERDRLVLSKGHAAPMLYACLARAGLIEDTELSTLRDLNSKLQGHPCMQRIKGIEISSGSLGLGLSVGVGMAVALRETKAHVYVLLGDGEMQEGQNWEAVMSIRAFKLNNITPIIDLNGVQLDGTTDNVQPNQTSVKEKLQGFGIDVTEIDGHDETQIEKAFIEARNSMTPHAVIARTVKGKGVSFMEGRSEWHGKTLDDEHYWTAVREIEGRL